MVDEENVNVIIEIIRTISALTLEGTKLNEKKSIVVHIWIIERNC